MISMLTSAPGQYLMYLKAVEVVHVRDHDLDELGRRVVVERDHVHDPVELELAAGSVLVDAGLVLVDVALGLVDAGLVLAGVVGVGLELVGVELVLVAMKLPYKITHIRNRNYKQYDLKLN